MGGPSNDVAASVPESKQRRPLSSVAQLAIFAVVLAGLGAFTLLKQGTVGSGVVVLILQLAAALGVLVFLLRRVGGNKGTVAAVPRSSVPLRGSGDALISENQDMTTFLCAKCGHEIAPAAQVSRDSDGMPYHPQCFDPAQYPRKGQTVAATLGGRLQQAVSPNWAGPQPEVQAVGVHGVVVRDIHMPFGSMVSFMVKWAIASIPALLILLLIGFIAATVFGSCFAASIGHMS